MAHRAVLCAALAKGTSHLHHLAFSKDISATLGAAGRLCARVTTGENDAVVTALISFCLFVLFVLICVKPEGALLMVVRAST